MRIKQDKQEDKKYLVKLTKALDCSLGRLKLDECNSWNIIGTRGKISTDTEFWYLYTNPDSTRKWNNTKKQLSFMEIHQDGDFEGILRCSRMPLRDEAREVRKVIGVRASTQLTEEGRIALRNRLQPLPEGGFPVRD